MLLAIALEGDRGSVCGRDGLGGLRVAQLLPDTVAGGQRRRPPVVDLRSGEEVPPGRARPHHCQDGDHGGHSHPSTAPPPPTRAGLRSPRCSLRVLRARLTVESGGGGTGDTGAGRHRRTGEARGPCRSRAERNLSGAGDVLLPAHQGRRIRGEGHRGRGRRGTRQRRRRRRGLGSRNGVPVVGNERGRRLRGRGQSRRCGQTGQSGLHDVQALGDLLNGRTHVGLLGDHRGDELPQRVGHSQGPARITSGVLAQQLGGLPHERRRPARHLVEHDAQ